ncbi:lantibiotic dehydratase family protein [Ktedonospora formicarum]|uniref:Lantibiotic dehydratase N-terminal domain-containing protein n=1 Tax=Ktedonospora formicarum TaxID=2778364 RepID=A0A8J3MX01_9CHLR|nr:lantibiotic dehydratase family protein [Ktedonospora formicarum]GHO49213.1 hypothetical protein KSX_73760 [Ktedonospora formicarum]
MLTPWYQPASFFMVRVPSLPFSLFTQLAESGHIEDFQEKRLEQRWHEAYLMSLETLAQYVGHPLVEQALIIASPSLYRALHELPTQQVDKDRRTSRAYERLLRYLIRMSSRPTPFGTCAGVAFGSFAQKSNLQLGEKRMLALRPDMRWLSAFLSSIEERFLSSLKVQVSTSLTLLGQRACIWQQKHRGTQSERVWLRMTPLLQTVCLHARQPIYYIDLKHKLLSDFPHVRDEHMETFLRTLCQRGVLLTTLFPPDDVEPLAYVRSQLQTNTEVAPLVKQLCSFQNLFRRHQALTNAQLDAIQQQQSTLTPHFEDVTLHVDTRQSLNQHELTSEIGKKAASIAETLLRLGLYPLGLPSVHRARKLFLERHEEQEVPLLDLFRPEGVFDNLYQQDMDLNDLPTRQQQRITERNHFLRMLAMQAVNARQKHIELTPDLIERLSCCPATQELSPPALLDLYMQVMAESQDAIDQGKWYGYASLLPLGGRSYRRFLHLYEHDESVQSQIRDLWRIDDALNPETLHATLAMYPSNMRDLNVMHGPLSNQYILPLHRASLSSTEQTIFPDDVLVSVLSGQFLLRSRFHNKPIRVTQPHMLSFTHLPPMARFLLEASHDGEAFPGAFQWGAAGDLPFIPRLVQGNTILSPAQWTLMEAILQLENHIVEPVDWFRAIQHWRGQWNVPRYVYLLEKEDRLLLDLECVLMVDLLRQELFKKGREKKQLQLQEAPPLEQMAWLRDQKGISYLSEFVIPLTRRTASPRPPSLPSVHKEISQVERCFLPGQEWLYIKLYLPEGLHNTLLTGPLHSFLQDHRTWFRGWFFVRYHDPRHIFVCVSLYLMSNIENSCFMRCLSGAMSARLKGFCYEALLIPMSVRQSDMEGLKL